MDKEQKAIKRIQMASEMSLHHYGKPLVCTYSGGKDSDVMLELFRRSGIPFEANNSHTTADAPQTVRHIRDTFRRLELAGIPCEIQMPTYKGERTSMWKLIPEKLMPPTRLVRYCCEVLKENGVKNRYIATGVRWAESTKRKTRGEFEKVGKTRKDAENFSTVMLLEDNTSKRRMTELCMQKNSMVVNPIIDWRDTDIWELEKILEEINQEKLKHWDSSERLDTDKLIGWCFDKCIDIIRKHMNDGWIPVEKRMPEVDADIEETIEDDDCPEYLVTIRGASESTVLKYSPDGAWFDENGYVYDVIAWRHLPEPYRPERSEE